jgi:ankyrin repeat protein
VGVGPWKEDVKTKTVRLLLQHGADFSGGKRFLYNLHAASFFGFDDVVVRELDDGFDVNTRGGHFGTALQAAVSGRYDRNSHAITKTKWDEMR